MKIRTPINEIANEIEERVTDLLGEYLMGDILTLEKEILARFVAEEVIDVLLEKDEDSSGMHFEEEEEDA